MGDLNSVWWPIGIRFDRTNAGDSIEVSRHEIVNLHSICCNIIRRIDKIVQGRFLRVWSKASLIIFCLFKELVKYVGDVPYVLTPNVARANCFEALDVSKLDIQHLNDRKTILLPLDGKLQMMGA